MFMFLQTNSAHNELNMGLLPDKQNCGLRMRRERFPATDIPGACKTRKFAYLVRGPCSDTYLLSMQLFPAIWTTPAV